MRAGGDGGGAGFEGFYREMAAAGPLDVELLVTTAAGYGCEITGPTPERSRAGESLLGPAAPDTDPDVKTGEIPG